ncbi:alpha-1,2-fucosyltransferase [Spirosoma fluviale]|uniref:Glycosyl transferase family 11 n=1 Tax=Spirosoma fluviale TaxID=1597977 RepID=A0A286FDH0_9BACT|nr:alpha-1,2-fucosyltransferase [Spirosoma fluviale]SOD81233.1 Glycosyl transferase family 11 [Spirosoma fluviale]
MKIHFISIVGGLGNQMFQYAYYLNYKKGNLLTYYLVVKYGKHNGFELDKAFSLPNNSVKSFSIKIIKKIFSRYIERVEDNDWGQFVSCNPTSKFIFYHTGYWQSEKYFNNIPNQIRNVFKFNDEKLNLKTRSILHYIDKHNTVSLHIRRGDYYDESYKGIFIDLCEDGYYDKAINKIKQLLNTSLIFIIFSDDISWVKANFHHDGFVYVDWNKGRDSWQDMYLMTRCKHSIISNSTFSWWGAWLNQNKGKTVIAPNKWFKFHIAEDIVPSNWIKI